jgi:colanic acid biosynthesis glycosyl transferase WcaI
MKVLIYGINYSPELTGIGKYTGEMASWLAAEGHEIRVVTSPPYYPKWRIGGDYRNCYSQTDIDGIRVTRCPLFVPSRPTALTRILHLLSFSLSSAFPILGSLFWKPDIVIQIVPTLFCSFQTLLLSRLSSAKAVVHIQDYEVDAMLGLSMLSSGIVQRFGYWIEQKILNRFDLVSTISDGMMKRAIQKGVRPEKLIFFPNWSETKRFRDVKKNKNLLKELGIASSKKIILYSGNMGEKQGLEIVINVAKSMMLNTGIHFLMVGEGAAKVKLEYLASTLSLTNMTFIPLQPYEKLPELLALASCHLIIQRLGVADAVLPSKLTNILAVGGNAVITANLDTSLGALCSKFDGIATLVTPESIAALQNGILTALKLPEPNYVASLYAQGYLDKDAILNQFFKDITQCKKS